MSQSAHGFKEGQPVWVEDGDGQMHPAIFLGEAESASWLGGVPRAHVVDSETNEGMVVPIFRITPRDE
jgi:hypothetical protein